VNSGRRSERSRIDERARAVLAGFDLLGGNQPRSLIDKYAPASSWREGERFKGYPWQLRDFVMIRRPAPRPACSSYRRCRIYSVAIGGRADLTQTSPKVRVWGPIGPERPSANGAITAAPT
jgi:hypothetical protein